MVYDALFDDNLIVQNNREWFYIFVIFPTQGSNLSLLNCGWVLYH